MQLFLHPETANKAKRWSFTPENTVWYFWRLPLAFTTIFISGISDLLSMISLRGISPRGIKWKAARGRRAALSPPGFVTQCKLSAPQSIPIPAQQYRHSASDGARSALSHPGKTGFGTLITLKKDPSLTVEMVELRGSGSNTPLLECGEFALKTTAKRSPRVCGCCSLPRVAVPCYKDQISWFIVLPPTGHHPHSSSAQSCTSCSKEERTMPSFYKF